MLLLQYIQYVVLVANGSFVATSAYLQYHCRADLQPSSYKFLLRSSYCITTARSISINRSRPQLSLVRVFSDN